MKLEVELETNFDYQVCFLVVLYVIGINFKKFIFPSYYGIIPFLIFQRRKNDVEFGFDLVACEKSPFYAILHWFRFPKPSDPLARNYSLP